MDFPDDLGVKNQSASAGDSGDKGSLPGSGDPLEKEMASTPLFLPCKCHEQRSL